MTKTDFQAKINEDKRYNPGRAVLCEKIRNTSCGVSVVKRKECGYNLMEKGLGEPGRGSVKAG